MKPGGALIFNHLLVHGSPNNLSPKRRRAMIIQFRINDKKRDQEKFDKENQIRTDFIINECKSKINQINSKTIYKDVKGNIEK